MNRFFQSRRAVIIVSIVVIGVIVAGALDFMYEPPPACSDAVNDPAALAYLTPKLESIGYSSTDETSFKIYDVVKDTTSTWPTYIFYFAGTKNGKVQWVSAVGNGCGIWEVFEMSGPLTITKIK